MRYWTGFRAVLPDACYQRSQGTTTEVLSGIPHIKLAAPKKGANLNKSEYSDTPHHCQPPSPTHKTMLRVAGEPSVGRVAPLPARFYSVRTLPGAHLPLGHLPFPRLVQGKPSTLVLDRACRCGPAPPGKSNLPTSLRVELIIGTVMSVTRRRTQG